MSKAALDKAVVITAELNDLEGRTFVLSRSPYSLVKLEEVKKRDVKLSYLNSTRVDTYTVSHSEFRKFYRVLPS